MISSDPVGNLRIELHRRLKDRILEALAAFPGQVLGTQNFKDYLNRTFENGSGLVELGYQVRLIERQEARNRAAIPPLKEVNDILRSSRDSDKKIEEISEYLDSHDTVGLGLPIRPYVLAGFNLMRQVFDQIVANAVQANGISAHDIELRTEVYHRLLAHGYAYRIAEELTYETGTGPEPNSNGVPNSARPGATKKAERDSDWEVFSGKPNIDSLLHAKAEIASMLIATSLDDGLSLAYAAKVPNTTFGEEEALAAKEETAAFFLHIADKFAFMELPANGRNVFMDALEANVIAELAEQGVDPSHFTKLLEERYIEYCDYKKWFFKKDESAKGTLFWEFAKKVATALGVGEHLSFNIQLSGLALRHVEILNLPGLMNG